MNNFSIIIPIYNCKIIWEILLSFFQINYPRDKFEIIIIDDGSDVKYKIQAQYYISKYKNILNLQYKYIGDKKWQMRVNMLRNIGASFSKHEFLIFVDGDCLVPHYFLLNYDSYITNRHTEKDVIVGHSIGYNYTKTLAVDPNDIVKKNYKEYILSPKHSDFRKIGHYDKFWHVFLWWNFCLSQKQFKGIWKWDEKITSWWEDDIDYGYRIHQKWYSFLFLRRIEVYNIKDFDRMTRERFYSTLDNQCYVYEKHKKNKEYLEYVYQRFVNTEYVYKKNNIPTQFVKLFFKNTFFNKIIEGGYIFILIHIETELSEEDIYVIKNILNTGIYVNLIFKKQNYNFQNLLYLKETYFFKLSFCTSEYLWNLDFIYMFKGITYSKDSDLWKELWKYGYIKYEFNINNIKEIKSSYWRDLVLSEPTFISLDELQTYIA